MAALPSARADWRPRVVVVDADVPFVDALERRLAAGHWEHWMMATAVSIETLLETRLSGVIMDVGALGDGGLDWMRSLRARAPRVGIVVCTRLSTLSQRVAALRAGVDAWVTKPVHPEELLARVEVVVRRGRAWPSVKEKPALRRGELTFAAGDRRVFAGNQATHFRIGYRFSAESRTTTEPEGVASRERAVGLVATR